MSCPYYIVFHASRIMLFLLSLGFCPNIIVHCIVLYCFIVQVDRTQLILQVALRTSFIYKVHVFGYI